MNTLELSRQNRRAYNARPDPYRKMKVSTMFNKFVNLITHQISGAVCGMLIGVSVILASQYPSCAWRIIGLGCLPTIAGLAAWVYKFLNNKC